MKWTNMIALTLVIVGALNWGLIGFFNFDLVTALFNGNLYWLARVIFALVGVAGGISIEEWHASTTRCCTPSTSLPKTSA